ncbi:hypothetical protein [Nonomuraea sp. NPDC049028]|uniref:hypothetical protein n=1 Tax=Nonomuraea sp. NPDC049028 TaxID=3364348 RepID=UPI003711F28F
MDPLTLSLFVAWAIVRAMSEAGWFGLQVVKQAPSRRRQALATGYDLSDDAPGTEPFTWARVLRRRAEGKHVRATGWAIAALAKNLLSAGRLPLKVGRRFRQGWRAGWSEQRRRKERDQPWREWWGGWWDWWKSRGDEDAPDTYDDEPYEQDPDEEQPEQDDDRDEEPEQEPDPEDVPDADEDPEPDPEADDAPDPDDQPDDEPDETDEDGEDGEGRRDEPESEPEVEYEVDVTVHRPSRRGPAHIEPPPDGGRPQLPAPPVPATVAVLDRPTGTDQGESMADEVATRDASAQVATRDGSAAPAPSGGVALTHSQAVQVGEDIVKRIAKRLDKIDDLKKAISADMKWIGDQINDLEKAGIGGDLVAKWLDALWTGDAVHSGASSLSSQIVDMHQSAKDALSAQRSAGDTMADAKAQVGEENVAKSTEYYD